MHTGCVSSRKVAIRRMLLTFAIAWYLVGCTLGREPDFPPKGSLARGFVHTLYIQEGEIIGLFIDQDPADLDAYYTRISAAIDENTHVYRQRGEEYTLIDIRDIAIGNKVAAYFTDAVGTSNPPVGQTHLIIVLER